MGSDFELVQVHECRDYAEVVIRDKNSMKVYAGNLPLSSIPAGYYPPAHPATPQGESDE